MAMVKVQVWKLGEGSYEIGGLKIEDR